MIVDEAALSAYLAAGDRLLPMLREHERPGDDRFASHRWLLDSAAKRLIYDELYGDLLDEGGRRVLDVGGGFTSLSRVLAERNDYTLVDLMAHDDADAVRAELAGAEIVTSDWYAAQLASYDVIIANDLLPNVDQRLEPFLERMLPVARELRLSLTYYDEWRFYTTRRVDAGEILVLLAWDGPRVRAALEPVADRIVAGELPPRARVARPSLFPNGRQVALVRLRGDKA